MGRPADRDRPTRELTSLKNPFLKSLRRALAEGVTPEGWLAVEGPHLVDEALKATETATVRCIVFGQNVAAKLPSLVAGLPPDAARVQVPDRLFQKIAQTENSQGIAALVELRQPELEATLTVRDGLFLVACQLQDPGNLGTMVRSALALGATALIALAETVSPFNPKAVRSSAGAIFHLPAFTELKPSDLFPRLRACGVRTFAGDPRSPLDLSSADFRTAVAVLVGNEGAGLPVEISKQADQLVTIPIRPGTDSLNAATAAGIFLYEAARQRGFKY